MWTLPLGGDDIKRISMRVQLLEAATGEMGISRQKTNSVDGSAL
jgi:hypothetical protein